MIPRVLLVEDQVDDVIFIRRAFRKANLTVDLVVVVDGDRAVEHLNEEQVPTLVLLDVKLPRRSGLEVLAWLRAQERLALVPVVMLTSSSEAADVQRAYALGANSYLVKPVQSSDLNQMVVLLGAYWLDLNTRPSMG